ncbi:MAG: hypothetical protein QOD85_1157 [Gaiellaceae bacterium]|nr:hypothetical protein [Gaiellaceae bacterium]
MTYLPPDDRYTLRPRRTTVTACLGATTRAPGHRKAPRWTSSPSTVTRRRQANRLRTAGSWQPRAGCPRAVTATPTGADPPSDAPASRRATSERLPASAGRKLAVKLPVPSGATAETVADSVAVPPAPVMYMTTRSPFDAGRSVPTSVTVSPTWSDPDGRPWSSLAVSVSTSCACEADGSASAVPVEPAVAAPTVSAAICKSRRGRVASQVTLCRRQRSLIRHIALVRGPAQCGFPVQGDSEAATWVRRGPPLDAGVAVAVERRGIGSSTSSSSGARSRRRRDPARGLRQHPPADRARGSSCRSGTRTEPCGCVGEGSR